MITVESLTARSCLHASTNPDDILIVQESTGEQITFADFQEITEQLDSLFESWKLHAGSAIACLLDNHWSIFALIAAASNRGVIIIPLSPHLHSDELRRIIKHSEAAVVVRESPLPLDLPNSVRQYLVADVLSAARSLPRSTRISHRESASDEPLLVIYTSGSTGQCKGVLLSERNLMSDAQGIAECYGLSRDDNLLCVMPCDHMNALMITGLAPLWAGACVSLCPRFDYRIAKYYLQKAKTLGATILSVTPSIMAVLLRISLQPERLVDAGIRLTLCGAAALPSAIWRAFESRFGLPVYQGYGLTETTCWAAMTPPGKSHEYETVGVPVNCTIKIDNAEEGTSWRGIPAGEVLVKGPIVMQGYVGQRVFRTEWLRTGDLGCLTNDGRLVITGRKKDVIIRSGINVLPTAIDDTLREHPLVEDCSTVGLPDDIRGESVNTAVIAHEEVDERKLMEWLQEKLSSYTLPDRIHLLGDFPRTATGKVIRREVQRVLDGTVAQEIVASFNTNRYVRHRLQPDNLVHDAVQRFVCRSEPVRFVKYWGAGNRGDLAEPDHMAISRLVAMLDEIRAQYKPGATLTLIFTYPHARLNQKDTQCVERYFAQIKKMVLPLEFETVSGAEIWTDGGLDLERVVAEAATAEFTHHWKCCPIRDDLIAQAGKHSNGCSPETAARQYYCACQLETPLFEKTFPHAVFLTYNKNTHLQLLPNLPMVHLHSIKKNTARKPWFVDG